MGVKINDKKTAVAWLLIPPASVVSVNLLRYTYGYVKVITPS